MKKSSPQKKIVIGILGTILVLAIGIISMKGLASLKPQPEKKVQVNSEPYVLVETVKYKDITSSVTGSGKLIAFSEIDIVAEGAGKIENGNVVLKKGATFKKGDILAQIYNDEALLGLRAQKSRFITSLTRTLPDIRIDYPSFYNTIEAYTNSLSTNKTFPEFPDLSNQKLEVFLSSKMILADYFAIKQMELSVSRYTVRAPWDGTILETYNDVGAYMNPGGRIVKIAQTNKYEIEIPVEIENASWLSIGQDVMIQSSKRAQAWHGKVSRMANFVDTKTQSRSVFVSVVNDGTMLNGEYVNASFVGETAKGVFEIPRNAIMNKNSVYIVADSVLAIRTISIEKNGEDYSLINGLNEGDKVVTEPLVGVKEGMKVKTLTAKQ